MACSTAAANVAREPTKSSNALSPLRTLPLLLDAASYEPCTFAFAADVPDGMPSLWDWLEVFRKSIPQFQTLAASDPDVPADVRQARAQQFADGFNNALRQLKVNPLASIPDLPKVDCLHLSSLRDRHLHEAGFSDPFRKVKADENSKALAHLPAVLRELDAVVDARQRHELAVRGVFAGNIFDLGAADSAALFNEGGGVFEVTRAGLVPRPWAVDDLEEFLLQLDKRPYRKALIFVDNAGSDIVLGVIPFARELLKDGTVVVLAANEAPCINDITDAELRQVVADAASADPVLDRAASEQALQVVSSGGALCVIDLSQVSEEVISAGEGADLVVLEGMGRAIETNLNARFTCDVLKLGMIKHREVATLLGGRMYDCVCKFEPAASPLHPAATGSG